MPEGAPPQPSPIWHPFTQHGSEAAPIHIDRAEGAHLHASDGRVIIDAISSWWVNPHGHGHPRIVRAVAEQAGRLDQIIFAGFTHAPAERLARKLLAITPPPLEFVFFSDSGSTAVEVAVKMAVGYWHNRGITRPRIIAIAPLRRFWQRRAKRSPPSSSSRWFWAPAACGCIRLGC